MQPTPFFETNELLDSLQSQLEHILGKKLVGLYLYGSVVMGDFDPAISDIDLLAAISSDLHPIEMNALRKMHSDIVVNTPQWENRLEIAYVPLKALKNFKKQSSKITVISPGEPFHSIEAGRDWLMNWYLVRENGLVVLGPPTRAFIEPVTKAEFLRAVREDVLAWDERMTGEQDRTAQSYAILTLCRGLYTLHHEEQASKLQAVAWVAEEFPQWASLVENALLWRQHPNEENVDHAATFPETRRFVDFVINLTPS
jgi:predicted nucleotidyltransferase